MKKFVFKNATKIYSMNQPLIRSFSSKHDSEILNDETINTIKSTIPILKENGLALTAHFYGRIFKHNPEVKPFFNPAHQESKSQQKALA